MMETASVSVKCLVCGAQWNRFFRYIMEEYQPGFRETGGYPSTRWRSLVSASTLGTDDLSLPVSVECRVCGAHLNRFSRDGTEEQ